MSELTAEQRELLDLLVAEEGIEPSGRGIDRLPRDGKPKAVSFAQRRMWFLHRLDPGSSRYNLPVGVRLAGTVRPRVIGGALTEVARRHDVLRTVFEIETGEPRQVALPAVAEHLPVPRIVDLTVLPPTVRARESTRCLREAVDRPFDLARGPVWRRLLVRRGGETWILLVVVHHVAADAWSMDRWVEEVTTLYRDRSRGTPDSLPEPPLQYADVAAWQNQRAREGGLREDLEYWRQRLEGFDAPPQLPTDRPRDGRSGAPSARCRTRFDGVPWAALQSRVGRGDGTWFTFLVAAFAILLARYTGAGDVTLGTPVTGRTRVEMEGLLGFFVNTLVLRMKLSDDPDVETLVRRVREVVLDAQAHQELPFEKLVEELRPERRFGQTPFFQTLLTVQSASGEAADLAGGISVEPLEMFAGQTRFDWILYARPTETAADLVLEFRADLFDPTTCRRALSHLQRALRALVDAPGRRLSQLSLLAGAERHQLVLEWNDEADFVRGPGFLARFLAAAEQRSDAPAVRSGDRCWTYGELSERVHRWAYRLREEGIGPETPVAVYVKRSPETVLGMLAVLAAGGVHVPLEPGGPRLRLAEMLGDLAVDVAITTRELEVDLPAGIARRFLLEETGTLAADGVVEPPAEADPESLAYVIFTSGSTGRPKPVGVERRHLDAYLEGLLRRLPALTRARARYAMVSTPAADLGATAWLPALATGGCLDLLPAMEAGDPEAVADRFEAYPPDFLKIVPAHLRALLSSSRPASVLPRRWLVLGGDACDEELLDRVGRRVPGCRVLNHYGPTETTVGVVLGDLGSAARVPGRSISLGRPLPPARLRVVDRRGASMPLGVPGELWIGGETVSRGYLGRSARTAESFVPDPAAGPEVPGARCYRSGDLVRQWHDGRLEFLGRIDRQIKIRGFRVEPGEISQRLKRCPEVVDCAVAALPEDAAPGVERRLVAWIVLREGSGTVDLRGRLARALPEALIPSDWVYLDSLPRTRNGKLDRGALPRPETDDPPPDRGPRTPLEETVAGTWCEVLGRDVVDVEADFFSQGGHSLLATQVASRLRRSLGCDVPLRLLFEAPTVAAQAAALGAKLYGKRAALPPVEARGGDEGDELPLSFAQERLWVLDRLAPQPTAYLLHYFVELNRRLVPGAFHHALQEMVRRHETLRTRFPVRRGRPVQLVESDLRVRLPRVDLRRLDAAAGRRELCRLARRQMGRAVPLDSGPPWHLRLVCLGTDDWAVLWTLHHVISDGWSRRILQREIAELLAAFEAGRPSSLPEPSLQYADYALWQRRTLRGEALETLLDYWTDRLGDGAGGDLPLDRPRPAVQSYRGAVVETTLPESLVTAVGGLARRRGATLYMALMTSLQGLIHRYSGSSDIRVGSPVAHRTRPEIEGLIGFFVNVLVVRSDWSGGPDFLEALERIRDAALGAFAHQDLPFEKLVDALRPERELSRPPLFRVAFVLQNASPAAGDGTMAALRPLEVVSDTAKFDLSVVAEERGGEVVMALEYAADLFDRVTMLRFVDHWVRGLAAAVDQPREPFATLALSSPAQRHQLVWEWNDTGAFRAASPCVHELIEARGIETPERLAVSAPDGDLTYEQLRRRSHRLARRLRVFGVGPEVRVGLSLPRSSHAVVAALAVWKAGGAYVPLDPRQPVLRLRQRLEDAGCAVVVGAGEPPRFLEESPTVLARWLDATAPADDPIPTEAELPDGSTPGLLAYVLYTSGTTGRPKGVMISHRALAGYLLWSSERYRAAEGAGAPVHTPMEFDLTVTALWSPLVAGGTVHLLPDAEDPEGLSRWMAQRTPTEPSSLVKATPSHLKVLHQRLPAVVAAGKTRALVIGGEALEGELLSWFREHAPETRLINEYGPTETVVGCTLHEVPPGAVAKGPVPIGRPVPRARVHLLGEFLRPVPLGAVGEIYIGGESLGRGYLHRPAATAAAWIPDPWADRPGSRLYRSGDLARRRAEGELVYLGRGDRQLKIRGHRVEPGEIEAALASHPRVRTAVVGTAPGAGGHPELVAWWVPGRDAGLEPSELEAYLGELLPGYMVPTRYVVLRTLPLAASGKVDRDALPAPPPLGPSEPSAAPRMPRSRAQRLVSEIWQRVLGVESVGLRDNFFDLGGNSLLLVEVQGHLEEASGRTLSTVDLFRHPTVAEQATWLDEPEDRSREPVPWPMRGAPEVRETPVAVIGLAGRFPGAASVDALWQNLAEGRESITFFSPEELEAAGHDGLEVRRPEYVRARAVLDDADLFDAEFFGFSPREAEGTDPQHRLLLESAWQALEDAGYPPDQIPVRVGVFAGCSLNRYGLRLTAHPDVADSGDMQVVFNNDKDFLPTRISYKLNLRGPSVAVQTACSSSLVAVHQACRSLWAGECELALAGGVSVRVPQTTGYLYQAGGIASPDGHCRPFSAAAGGTVSGSGLGLVVLKPLAAALTDGDHVRAVIRGSAVNNDGGHKVGYSAPGVEGQASVIRQALAAAGVEADTVTYVEAHGTGTALGDPVEVAALTEAFRTSTRRRGYCALGSIKSNIGHLDAASGIAGLIKTVLALEHGQIPPSLHGDPPHPDVDFPSTPFFVNIELADWRPPSGPRRAGVSSFGIGGTNAHVVLEEAPDPEPRASARPSEGEEPVLWTLSARSETALEVMRRRLAEHLTAHEEWDHRDLQNAAFTLQAGRRRFPHRLTVVARNREEAVWALSNPEHPRCRTLHDDAEARPVAFLFPGQGAQHLGMGAELARIVPSFRSWIRRGIEALHDRWDLDVRSLLAPPAEADVEALERRLHRTEIVQPALFLVEYALASVWREWGIEPAVLVGHSLGEYAAACCAGILDFDDALDLVALRGRLMASCPPGAMVSVALGEDEVTGYLSSDVSLAAVNGAGRCVVSGPVDAIDDIERRWREAGVPSRRMESSQGFHSVCMEPILGRFREHLETLTLRAPRIPVVSSVHGSPLTDAQATDPEYWVRQLRSTVRFHDALTSVYRDPERVLLEVGPGRILSSMARRDERRCAGNPIVTSLGSPRDDGTRETERLFLALSRLWLLGAQVDWRGFHGPELRRRVPLPTYPFERRRYWRQPPAGAGAAMVVPRRGKEPDPARWFYVPSWSSTPPARLMPPVAEPEGPWLVWGDGAGWTRAMREVLGRRGIETVFVSPGPEFERRGPDEYILDPDSPTDPEHLWSELEEDGCLPRVLLYAWALPGAEGVSEDRPAGPVRRQFSHGLLFLARSLARRRPALGLDAAVPPMRFGLLTAGLHDVFGGEETEPDLSLLSAYVRCLPSEAAGLDGRAVDWPSSVDPETARVPGGLLDLLVDDLSAGDAEDFQPMVAYRNGRRWVETFERVELRTSHRPGLKPRGVYVITGGLGGVGFEMARHLAETVSARLVLVGRRPVPEDEDSLARRRLRKLESTGAEVLTLTADAADEAQVRTVMQRARARFGAVHGVIHAAGVPASGLLATRETEPMEAVLAPKVDGTRALAAAAVADAGEDPPEFLLLCSSLRTVLGGAGRTDYVAANRFLGAFATSCGGSLDGMRVVALDSDTWRDVGMSAAAAIGQGRDPAEAFPEAMTSPEGVDALLRGLVGGLPRVLISTCDLTGRLARASKGPEAMGSADRPTADVDNAPRHERPDLSVAYVAPRNPTETELAAVWEELLGIEAVGVRDNFFELGGDSVVGLQVVARARKRGIELSPQQVFESQTLEELAGSVDSGGGASPVVRQELVTGPVPLTPIQRWFFDLGLPRPGHWNQALLLALDEPPPARSLAISLEILLRHHDALRLRFRSASEGMPQARCAPPESPAPFLWVDLSALPPDAQRTALERSAATAQRSLDLERGPLMRTVLYRMGPQLPARLLWVIHHLAVDAVSWRILLEDLEDSMESCRQGLPLALPAKTTSFQQWARRLETHAESPDVLRDRDLWESEARRHVEPLPRDRAGQTNTPSRSATVTGSLSPEETDFWLHEAPRELGADVRDGLLYGLARALRSWSGSSRILVDLEGHGREPVFPDVDVSRTVGWFTTLYPVLLDLSGPEDRPPLDELRIVGDQVRELTDRSLGYGLLRWLSVQASASLEALPKADVKLLYLGQMDRVLPSGGGISEAPESGGPAIDPQAPRSHALDVTARVFEGRLHVVWTYGEELHDRRTIDALAATLLDELRAVPQHARAKDARGSATDVSKPSTGDFPQVAIDEEELEDLMERLVD